MSPDDCDLAAWGISLGFFERAMLSGVPRSSIRWAFYLVIVFISWRGGLALTGSGLGYGDASGVRNAGVLAGCAMIPIGQVAHRHRFQGLSFR